MTEINGIASVFCEAISKAMKEIASSQVRVPRNDNSFLIIFSRARSLFGQYSDSSSLAR